MDKLKKNVCEANKDLVKNKLVILTWGNVSGADRENDIMIIKPSGVPYDELAPDKMVLVKISTGEVLNRNSLKPSSDTLTHLTLYKKYREIGGIVHTHSTWSTAFAQSGTKIVAAGTTHADYFNGDIFCTRKLTNKEITNDYELNTGLVIIETLMRNNIHPLDVPAILVNDHGPFTWGKNSMDAVENAVVLEQLAKMNFITSSLNSQSIQINKHLLKKHFSRKHGKNAYYGQK
ncbi:MAG: L-ribulose-5-phosphate 4-epimerase AraD [Mycoplasmataceae bacterium]|nr:L-ribulose-5-phosphate 4-epimerase AraD [Mycoplasmataceae bacterium]